MNLKEELHTQMVGNMNLSSYIQVAPETPVRQVVALMREEGVSVCLILEGETLVGILTDRDVLQSVSDQPESWDKPVREVMTAEPITISPETSAAEAVWLMDEKQIRVLPAVDSDGKVVGNMTHRAVVTYLASRYPTDILNLPPEPNQFPDQAEGG